MSSILLSNPFISPIPPSGGVPNLSVTSLTVAPLQNLSAGRGTENATSFSGSGSGHSGGSDQQPEAAIIRNRAKSALARYSDATSTSVVNAQTQEGAEITPYGVNLPKVEMPDPLPTSPFLRSMSVMD